MCAVHVAVTKGTPFKVAELVEQEKGVIAGAAKMAVLRKNSILHKMKDF